MADGTVLNTGVFGDTIRDFARPSVTTPGAGTSAGSGNQTANTTQKTQAVAIDGGGASGNAEALLAFGQAVSSNCVPVILASDQQSLPAERITALIQLRALQIQVSQGGWVPTTDIPEWAITF